MNKTRREKLAMALDMIREVAEDEEAALDNLPDSFRYGQQGEEMDEIMDQLREVVEIVEFLAMG